VINPIEVVEKYGADALRFALIVRSSPGLDKSVGEADFKAARNFTNKIWNAARFVILMQERDEQQILDGKAKLLAGEPTEQDLAEFSNRFDEEIKNLIEENTINLEEVRLGMTADTLAASFWHFYCDVAIEFAKAGALPYSKLVSGLKTYLKLLHPFVPFVTEQIWTELHEAKLGTIEGENEAEATTLLIRAGWPKTT
jgi:valyl-tRNA synthetase